MNKMPAKLEFLVADAKIIEEAIVDEKTGDKVMTVEAKWQQADIINVNKRKYPRAILNREIEKLAPSVAEGAVFGASYHPKTGDAEVDDVSHIWTKVWMEDDGSCMGHAKILPTSRGKNAQVLIKHGGRIGVSSRGYGTVTSKSDNIEGENIPFNEVNEDFRLRSPGDFVLTPSVPGAKVRGLIESQMNESDDSYSTKNGDEETMKFANVEELQKAYPEMVQSIKSEATTAATTAAQDGISEEVKKQVAAALETAKEEWKTEFKLDEITAEITEIKKAAETVVDAIRASIVQLSDIPGVIGEEDDSKDKDDKDTDKKADTKVEDEETKQKIADQDAKIKQLEDQAAADKKTKEDAETAESLQTDLKSKLDEELAKEENKQWSELIEKDLVSDGGKILLDSVEKVQEAVADAKTRISETLVLAERSKIITGGVGDIGNVEDSKGGDKKSLTEDQIDARWEQALAAGSRLSRAEYKEKVLNLKE